jgi:hypothetical protein
VQSRRRFGLRAEQTADQGVVEICCRVEGFGDAVDGLSEQVQGLLDFTGACFGIVEIYAEIARDAFDTELADRLAQHAPGFWSASRDCSGRHRSTCLAAGARLRGIPGP